MYNTLSSWGWLGALALLGMRCADASDAPARGRRWGLRPRQLALRLLPVLERSTVDVIGGMPALFVGERQFQLCLRGQEIAQALCVFGSLELEQRLPRP